MTFSLELVIVGALTGLAYAILASGLVLVYRATRVINFAHGEMGAFGAALLAKLVLDLHWNFFVAFLLVLVVGALVGGVVELGVIRRLFHAPRLILLVATIGVSQILFFASAVLPDIENTRRYPTGLNRVAEVGGVLLRGEHFMVLAFVPAVIAGLALFLNVTPYGMAIRASAENAEAARLAGVSVKRVSTVVWVLAGVLSTATFVLINPIRGTIVGTASVALGPSLLLRALVAALCGRLVSLPLTLVGGIVVGIVEALLFVNVPHPGTIDGILFAAVLVLVFTRGRDLVSDEKGSFSLTPRLRPMPSRLLAVGWVRRLPLIAAGTAFVIAVLLPLVFTAPSRQFLFSRVAIFAIVGLSISILTGWGGQLSLGQFAFVGLGAFTAFALVDRGMPFSVAILYSAVGGVLVALAVGGPALRIRGLSLAVTTLAFAVAARGYFLPHRLFTGGNENVFLPRAKVLFLDLRSQRTYYYFCLAFLLVSVFVVSRLRSSGIGRTIIAVRDNDRAAAALTVSPSTAKLTAFAISGGLAAMAGALLAGAQVQFGPSLFGPEQSLIVVAMVIIGGLGSVAGSVLGAVYVVGLPALFGDTQEVRLLTSGAGLLILLMYLPGGLLQIVYKVRDVLLSVAERRLGPTPDLVPAVPRAVTRVPTSGRTADAMAVALDVPAVAASGITVRFGGVTALDGVTVTAMPGETLGLIGSNGAGKSTLMNVMSGFQPTVAGAVEMFGSDVTHLAPHERSRLGLGRVFQDARLFGELTVRECVAVALEARERSELVPSALALPPATRAEARKRREADELMAFVGLGRYADSVIGSLSTGTRRIAELACLIALDAKVLLLDEPTAGVAQRETEAFGPLIARIRSELDATLVIIEHDMPLVMSLSDRVYCLSAGKVIAEGVPDDVRHNPAVIAAYLGTDERAIQRSDTRRAGSSSKPPPGTGPRRRRAAPAAALHAMSRTELVEVARGQGITGLSGARKADLIMRLERLS
jgi:ABC-type branched-subunit amino acid transport system ATPase component/ABC-type branched-subunit amino acid transport system permease subunit